MADPYDPLDKLKKQVEKARERRKRRWRRRIAIAGGVATTGGLMYELRPSPPRPEPLYALVPETLYAQRTLTLHSRPDSHASIVRTVNPYERVTVAQLKDSPWVRVFDAGRPASFAYRTRATLLPVRPTLPPPPDTMAVCADSTPWFSPTSGGACSGRHGVLCWIDYPPPVPARMSKPYCKYALTSAPIKP